MKLVLMGTGPFAVPAFEALRAAGHAISAVYTKPQVVAGGRTSPPSPVQQWAQSHALPLETPASANTGEVVEQLRQMAADLLVVCDYGQILKAQVLETTPLGGINLHGSLLPAFRGAAPVQWAVWSGAAVTGVSVIHMTPRLDAGPVLTRHATNIQSHETAGALEHRLAEMGVPIVLEAVAMLSGWDRQSPLGTPQDEQQTSKAPRLSKSDGQVQWQQPAVAIDAQVRAMQPWPCAYSEVHPAGRAPSRIVFRAVTPISDQSCEDFPPGQVIRQTPQLWIATGQGVLQVDRLQAAGKREMSAAEYLRGHPLFPGTEFRGCT